MKDEIELGLMSLQFKFGFWIGFTSWQAALRLTLGWFSSVFEKWMAGMVPEDREWITTLVNKRWYRVLRALLNVLASVKLPGREALEKARTGNTDIITKPTDPPASPPLTRNLTT